jgi:coenzyme F420-reducing hydrogenase alpha subunit
MREITLNHITKIEGHASLKIGIEEGKVKTCELSSVEGARYFEGIVKGRHFFEAHEMTSRICGICSCAHVIAAIQAIENAIGYVPSEQTKELRVLMTLGERIRSHATHLYFLALPDYTGYESALAMAKKYKKELQTALHLMKVGNLVIKTLASRDLHPVSATVGGWLKLPRQEELDMLHDGLVKVKADAVATCDLFSSLSYPDFSSEGDWFSLQDEHAFAVLEGDFVSEHARFKKSEYRNFIREYHEPRSTSNFVVKGDHRYMVGALARLNNSSRQLSKDARDMLLKSPIRLPSRNPYHNNVAQAIELVHCVDHAVSLLEDLKVKPEKHAFPKPRAGIGVGAIEVPRGTLWHEYEIDEKGVIVKANIITPTAQNLLNIQEDIRMRLPALLEREKEEIVTDVEKLIRSYDPCFSCSAHFLEVKWV